MSADLPPEAKASVVAFEGHLADTHNLARTKLIGKSSQIVLGSILAKMILQDNHIYPSICSGAFCYDSIPHPGTTPLHILSY